MIARFFLLISLLLFHCMAHAAVVLGQFSSTAFNPSKGESFEIPVHVESPGKVFLTLYSPDGDVVRTLSTSADEKSGLLKFSWDGKDTKGSVVPDEAYVPVIRFVDHNKQEHIFDPRTRSGGEEVALSPSVIGRSQITFDLNKPSRVLARAGIKAGPMMKSILNWSVRSGGRNVLSWNGYDHDNLVDLYSRDDMALLVTAFELPDHSIITQGNRDIAYLSWRTKNDLTSEMPDPSEMMFDRDGKRLSRHYFLPRSVDIDPRVSLEIVDSLVKTADGIPIVTGPISLKVDMQQEDRWAMQQSLYEVAFFVDFQFLSEEEQGYVPLTWRWNPAGLKPGRHFITVNVSGFNGQVGVRSLQIEIPE